jgi:hypothetical protein
MVVSGLEGQFTDSEDSFLRARDEVLHREVALKFLMLARGLG